MKFRHVTLAVKDIEASAKFYQEIVGLAVIRQFSAGPGREIIFLGSGDTQLELISGADHGGAEPGSGVSMGFAADSLDEMIATLRDQGYETDGQIVSPQPGVTFFFAKDPDGYTVQFITE